MKTLLGFLAKDVRIIFCCMCWLLCFSGTSAAHEGHDHGHSLAVTVAFDAQGHLWRASAKDNFVWVDRSDDLGRTFAAPIKLNLQPQKIETSGDARPKIALGPEGNIYVTWTQALSKPYSGYIWFARSTDAGKSFAAPMLVHHDRAEITHRFDALAVAPTGRVFVAWVDKRDLIAAKAAKKLYDGAAIYYAISDDAGASFAIERKLADTTCECCRIALEAQPSGTAVAMWRHVFKGGVRDHAITQINPGETPAIKRATFGNWKIDACPHHGPALARGGDWGWHMAWFDGGEKPGLFYARMDGEAWVSSPAKRFGNANQQAGHPALLSAGEQVWLVWRELTEQGSMIHGAYSSDGGRSWSEARELAHTAGAADYPQLVAYQGQAYLAWNTASDGFRLIEIARAP